jgi:hypothetical protein
MCVFDNQPKHKNLLSSLQDVAKLRPYAYQLVLMQKTTNDALID